MHHMHGIEQGGSEARISSWTGFNHVQILTEIATHSFSKLQSMSIDFGHFDKIKYLLMLTAGEMQKNAGEL